VSRHVPKYYKDGGVRPSAELFASEQKSAGPGRPRDAELDDLILEAVRELLVEVGYQVLSVQEVVRRCNVHVRTIVRRWPTKAELVTAAISGGDESTLALPCATGKLRADLFALVENSLNYLSEPAIRAAIPALMAEMRTNERVAARLHRRQDNLRAAVQIVLEAAVASGDAPERVVRASSLLPNLITGATFSIQFMDADAPKNPPVDELTDLVMFAVLGCAGQNERAEVLDGPTS
jgi:AcrR family transcriptional regulator